MCLLGVDEAMRQVAVSVELRHGTELVAVDPGLLQFAVDFLAHAAVSTVDQVLDDGAVGQDYLAQVGGGDVGEATALGK